MCSLLVHFIILKFDIFDIHSTSLIYTESHVCAVHFKITILKTSLFYKNFNTLFDPHHFKVFKSYWEYLHFQGFVFCALLEFALVNYASRSDMQRERSRQRNVQFKIGIQLIQIQIQLMGFFGNEMLSDLLEREFCGYFCGKQHLNLPV